MTPDLLEEIGLNKTQAKVYLTLVESGALTPLQVADKTFEKRTNAYMVLDQLEVFNLVEKRNSDKKITYEATNPIALESLAEKKRKKLHEAETKVKQAMPNLLNYYYSFTEKPGIRMFQGVEGLKEIYADTLRSKQDIHLLRTRADIPNMTDEYLRRYRDKRASLGINTYALTPDSPEGQKNAPYDKDMLYIRTKIPADRYTAPVEVDVYGNRTAFAIFGEEVMGVVIDNPHLADAMRQLFKLLSEQFGAEQTSVPQLGLASSARTPQSPRPSHT